METLMSLGMVAVVIVGVAVLGAVCAIFAGKRAFQESTTAEVERLEAHTMGERPQRPEGDLARLPEPVQRYCRYALEPGQLPVKLVRMQQRGQMRWGQEWLPMTAEAILAPEPPGFVWWGKVQNKPWLWVAGRDSYLEGKGNMVIRLLATLTLGDFVGREMDLSGLVRVLTELAWAPTALGPDGPVQWETVDENAARAWLKDGDLKVAAVFTFGEGGEIRRVSTTDKFREERGRFQRYPWTATLGQYQRVAGMMIPTAGEASWHLPEGEVPYIRVQVTNIQYEFDKDRK